MSILSDARNLRELIRHTAVTVEDKTLAIAVSGYFEEWVPGVYAVGDVRRDPATGYPRECFVAHDSITNPDWTIADRTIWKPYHSRSPVYALPWEAPTGAHDRYLAGEYIVWTDGRTYHCIQDTSYSPADYSKAWEAV